ncbi:hypothetical protein HY571_02475 [Candidatus Micrarchaeota archaeon]|nr:hypothetical protein [Candidatus Micrarchaeota archaeon]
MNMFNEDLRQAAHLAVGITSVLAVLFIGLNSAILLMSIIFIGGLLLANFKLLGGKFKIIDAFLQLMERKTPVPGQGAMFFAAGTLLLLTFARPLEFGLGIIMLHTVGDAAATFIGRRFHTRLPWNTNKTLAGFVSFTAFGALSAGFFISAPQAFIYAALLAIVESLALPLDDNAAVPVAALLFKGVGL